MSEAQWGRTRNMDTIVEISTTHAQPPVLYSNSYLEPQQQHSWPRCWLALSRLQTLANQRPPNYHINMVSSNKLTLGFFFRQHRSLDKFWGHLHSILTPYSRFSKQNKPIWEEPLCSKHLCIMDTILMSRWCPL